MHSLNTLGLKYGTDKASNRHDYLDFYETFIKEYQDKEITILEFGCLHGASLNMWAEYFPKAQVVGVDVNVERPQLEHNNILLYKCDCTNPFEVGPILQKHSPTIIIDDASHLWSHQIVIFETSFYFLEKGGVYICEDLQTSFGVYRDKNNADYPVDGATFFSRLALAKLGRAAALSHPNLEDLPLLHKRIVQKIDFMAFRSECVLIKKALS
jgi:Cephalosporin hydroxylase